VKKEAQGVFSKLVGVMQASLKPKKQTDKATIWLNNQPMLGFYPGTQGGQGSSLDGQVSGSSLDDDATQDGCQLAGSSNMDGCQLAGSSMDGQPAIIIDATQLSASGSNMDGCAPPGSSMDGQPGNVDELSTSLMQIQIDDNHDVEPTNAWTTNAEGFTSWSRTKWWQHDQEVRAGGWINYSAEPMSAAAFQQWQIRMGRWVDWTPTQWRNYGWTGYEDQLGHWQDYTLDPNAWTTNAEGFAIPEEAPIEENIPALE
jgi:hypothetical protein